MVNVWFVGEVSLAEQRMCNIVSLFTWQMNLSVTGKFCLEAT